MFHVIEVQTIQILHFKWASIVELCSYSFFKLVYYYYYLCNNTTTATRRTTYPGFSALVGVADGGVGNFGIGLHTDGSTVLSNMWTQCFLSIVLSNSSLPASLVIQLHQHPSFLPFFPFLSLLHKLKKRNTPNSV